MRILAWPIVHEIPARVVCFAGIPPAAGAFVGYIAAGFHDLIGDLEQMRARAVLRGAGGELVHYE